MRIPLLLLAVALCVPGVAAAQADLAQADLDSEASPDTLARVATMERGRSTAVAVTIVVPTGSGSDPEGRAGAGWLLAHTLATEAHRRVAPLASRVTPRVLRGRTSFTLLAPKDGWIEPLRALLEVLFRRSPDPEVLEEVRRGLLDQLRFERNAPVRGYEQEVDNLLHGSAHPWSRPIRGNPTSVEAITLEELERLQKEGYRAADAMAAVVGPGQEEVRGILATPVSEPAPPVSPAPAWTSGDRISVVREVTNSWVAVAYPLAPDLPGTHAEFLRYVIREALVSSPPDPGSFEAQVRIEEGHEGPILLISAAVVPEVALRWERRVLDAISSLAREPEHPAFFRLERRRFRSRTLLARSAPEVESRAVARDLVLRGAPREVTAEIEALDPEDLRAAAAGLGPARILILGPDLSLEKQE